MTIETELKFLVDPAHIDQLKASLAAYPHQYRPPVILANHYYETATGQLRGWDMGLRIREKKGQFEMTLKTAGQEIGGLQQRPEYNIDLIENKLDLQKFPVEVWPAATDLARLQSELAPLFSTDFTREKWLVSKPGCSIEVAFDQGTISAVGQELPILELELELILGNRDDLFALASELAAAGGLSIGVHSKAARGYRLAQGGILQPVPPFAAPTVAAKADCQAGLETLLTVLLRRWQQLEQQWCQGAAVKEALGETLLAIRETFSQFGGLVPRQVSSTLRQQLLALEQSLSQEVNSRLCTEGLWASAQLELTQLIVEQVWAANSNKKQLARLQGSFKRFCDVMLSRTAAQLTALANEPVISQQATVTVTRLQQSLVAMQLLSSAYSVAQVNAWLAPWQQAVDKLKSQPGDYSALPLVQKPLAAYWLSSYQAKGSH